LPPRRSIISDIADVTAIRHLNDQLRQTLAVGMLVMTAVVLSLPIAFTSNNSTSNGRGFDRQSNAARFYVELEINIFVRTKLKRLRPDSLIAPRKHAVR
jgi:hypothetical protein